MGCGEDGTALCSSHPPPLQAAVPTVHYVGLKLEVEGSSLRRPRRPRCSLAAAEDRAPPYAAEMRPRQPPRGLPRLRGLRIRSRVPITPHQGALPHLSPLPLLRSTRPHGAEEGQRAQRGAKRSGDGPVCPHPFWQK